MQGAGARLGARGKGRRPYEGRDGSFAEGGEGGPAFRVRAASTRLSCRMACFPARFQGRTLSGLVTGKRPAEQISRKYVPESWKTCRFSAAALRAVRSKRHPSMPFAWSVRAFGPLNAPCAHLAVDRQMTPALFAVLLGPLALSPRSLADRLSGSASRPLRPKASRAPDCIKALRAEHFRHALPLRAARVASSSGAWNKGRPLSHAHSGSEPLPSLIYGPPFAPLPYPSRHHPFLNVPLVQGSSPELARLRTALRRAGRDPKVIPS